jgi:hypothetical protein
MIEEELLDELQNEIGVPIPRTFSADPRIFYRHLVEFYKSRGTPESIQAFFKLIYDDEVEIYFPKEDMLIPSDGKWFDVSADIIANTSAHTPAYKFTLAAATDTVTGVDDRGFDLKTDSDLIYVDDVLVSESTWNSGYYESGNKWVSYIKFNTTLPIGAVVKVYKKGLFTTTDGFASDKKYLQDSYFYQKFSYVLRTGKSIADWKNAFTRLIHPAGFIFFGEILIFINMLASKNTWVQPGYQKDGLPRNIYIDPVYNNFFVSELGTYVEKEYHYDTHIVTRIGFVDHFDNTKFINYRSMNDYGNITFEDVINKRIGGTQLGCQIVESTTP